MLMRMSKILCMFVYVKLTVFYVNIIKFVVELYGQVLSTRALYSEGTGFKSWPRDRLSWKFFAFCLFLQQNAGIQGGKRISTTGHSDARHSCGDVAPFTLKLCFWMLVSVMRHVTEPPWMLWPKLKFWLSGKKHRDSGSSSCGLCGKMTVLPTLPTLGTVLDISF